MTQEVYYRFMDHEGETGPYITLWELPVEKRTPKGAWVYDNRWYKRRWIPDNSHRKFAWPTKEEAQASFKKRKERQLAIIQRQAKHVWLILDRPEWAAGKELGLGQKMTGFDSLELLVPNFNV